MCTAPTAYLRTDHWSDVVESLEAAADFADQLPADSRQWKWLLIAVHCSTQGFMALALENGNALLVMKEHISSKWLKAHEDGSQYPDPKMDFFLSLYEKVKTDAICSYVGSKKFVPADGHDYSMNKLNELRNGFIHFFPSSWSIQIAGLPSVCRRCIEIAHFLGWESGAIIWHDGALQSRALAACNRLQNSLQRLEESFGPES